MPIALPRTLACLLILLGWLAGLLLPVSATASPNPASGINASPK